ncbi:hypothetical protein D3C81_1961580 [compost metagenome]
MVAALLVHRGADGQFLLRLGEAIAVAVGDGHFLVAAQAELIDAGDMATLDRVRHAADHIPGAHEPLQVDRRIGAVDRDRGRRGFRFGLMAERTG